MFMSLPLAREPLGARLSWAPPETDTQARIQVRVVTWEMGQERQAAKGVISNQRPPWTLEGDWSHWGALGSGGVTHSS